MAKHNKYKNLSKADLAAVDSKGDRSPKSRIAPRPANAVRTGIRAGSPDQTDGVFPVGGKGSTTTK